MFLWRAKCDPGTGQHANAAMLDDGTMQRTCTPAPRKRWGNCPTAKGLAEEVVQSPGNASHLVFDIRVHSNVPSLVTAAAEEEMAVLATRDNGVWTRGERRRGRFCVGEPAENTAR